MSMTREELALHTEWLDLQEAFVAAKDDGRGSKKYQAAKAAMSEFRAHWRGIREYLRPPAEDVAEDVKPTKGK